MNNAVTGTLLSGLVFPGLGQVVLKRYKRGIALMLTVSVSLTVIMTKAVQIALAILKQVDLQAGQTNLSAI